MHRVDSAYIVVKCAPSALICVVCGVSCPFLSSSGHVIKRFISGIYPGKEKEGL